MNDQSQDRNYLGQDTAPSYVPTSDEKTMAILCHVLTLFFWILPPLIIYLLKKDESSFIAEHAKESMNFQITWAIIGLILFVTIIGILLLWVVGIIVLVLVIVATIKSSEGKLYRYPFTLRLIK